MVDRGGYRYVQRVVENDWVEDAELLTQYQWYHADTSFFMLVTLCRSVRMLDLVAGKATFTHEETAALLNMDFYECKDLHTLWLLGRDPRLFLRDSNWCMYIATSRNVFEYALAHCDLREMFQKRLSHTFVWKFLGSRSCVLRSVSDVFELVDRGLDESSAYGLTMCYGDCVGEALAYYVQLRHMRLPVLDEAFGGIVDLVFMVHEYLIRGVARPVVKRKRECGWATLQ